ncbi:PREDICTED: uncharacterized protein LOC101293662 [Fragaria vesca subsp. vesca]|uniref:uncharacterized protein LOC101293662 n=1 Tax=Fragaria vesca subsp. vesca TaxID=101020 RepID=UPI0002C32BE7|nr:PREDICTED: uncharacterized protein LOC101293662 [Fragaria vesca subsp. vesca]XP_011459993.1 PREDICTED: uncharacterized protein LOC101293662 [Fragaria vesca subsp. vesca]XP_011459994.1 PREDICTED: uncharacterized protein LOC101293662 [Fragaria vesca subsp. vesca]XP_011459995.1 PREDICTED: uncharacterized protein LOC101293662 [Fragaria vesca subsp. vesca]
MADWNRMLSKSSGFGVGDSSSEDFQEEVWGVTQQERKYNFTQESCSSSSSSSSARSLSTAPRTIVKACDNSLSTHDSNVVQRSAPISIPDWSKNYGKNEDNHDGYDVQFNGEDDDANDNEDEMVPPHEWLARKLRRSQISCFSVVEGRGRTLKGRDLRKVRNGVWKQTGFLE